MRKDRVYSWRLSAARKSALEDAARREQTSVGALLERVTDEWLQERRSRGASGDEEQARLRAAALRCAGRIRGGDPERAAQARQRIRAKLTRRRGR
jgi:hypothetical protein